VRGAISGTLRKKLGGNRPVLAVLSG
jgi:hypothetical protein